MPYTLPSPPPRGGLTFRYTLWYVVVHVVNFRKFYAKRKAQLPRGGKNRDLSSFTQRGAEIILAIRVPNAFSNALWYALWYEQWNKYRTECNEVTFYLLTNRGLCGIARADKRDYFTKSALVKKKSFRQIKFFA